MNDKDLKHLLSKLPAAEPPEDLRHVLERDLSRLPPREAVHTQPVRGFFSTYGAFAFRAMAGAFMLLVCGWLVWNFFQPERSLLAASWEAIRKVDSFRMVGRTRYGEAQPVSQNSGHRTTLHPANPMVPFEYWQVFYPGSTQLVRSRHEKGDTVRIFDFPLSTVETSDGSRRVALNTSFSAIGPHPTKIFKTLADMEEQDRIEYTVKKLPDKKQLLVRVDDRDSRLEHRLWIDQESRLPVRRQTWSSQFPEYGDSVLLQECEFKDFGKGFDSSLFDLQVTEAELAEIGYDRDFLDSLDRNTLALRVEAEDGTPFSATIEGSGGKRRIEGTLPTTLFHERKGETRMTITWNGQSSSVLRIHVNGVTVAGSGNRVDLTIGEYGSVRSKWRSDGAD